MESRLQKRPNNSVKARFASILMLFLVCLAHAEEAYQATAKIWETMERKNWDAAIAQALKPKPRFKPGAAKSAEVCLLKR